MLQVKLVKSEVNRLHNNLMDWEEKIEKLPEVTTDVGFNQQLWNDSKDLKTQISEQNDSIRYVNAAVSSVSSLFCISILSNVSKFLLTYSMILL